MRKYFIILLVALVGVFACNKVDAPAEEPVGQEIVIGCDGDFRLDMDTKATALTTLPSSLYWGATTGTSTETQKYAPASASVSSSKIATGKFQTATPTAYNYYVANQNFSFNSTSKHMEATVANNNTDIVIGRTAANSSTTPSVTLNHIFARTGSLTINSGTSGMTVSNTSWKIIGKSTVNGTAGTYDMTSATWTAASTKLTSYTAITSSSDMYLIPGTYTMEFTYTLTQGDWTQTFTKHADATLVGGKINNMTISFNSEADPIVISVSLAEWGTNTITLTPTD